MPELTIPPQLCKEEFRFALVLPNNKIPFEKDWNRSANYKYNDQKLLKHIENGGNYSVCGGFGNLVIIDFDNEAIENEIGNILPSTFTVRSGRGRKHFYYITDIPENLKAVGENKDTYADIQGAGKCVVGAGSIHPNGNRYEVIDDSPIGEILIDTIKVLFSKYLVKEKTIKKRDIDDPIAIKIKEKICISDLMREYGYDTTRNPTMCQLGHESESKKCFTWNDQLGKWHCFNCHAGGDLLNFLMAHNKISFFEARKLMMKRLGITDTGIQNTKGLSCDEIQEEVLTKLALRDNSVATEIIVRYLLDNFYIYTTRDDEKSEVWIYNEGIYIPQGRTYIKEKCREILGDAYNAVTANRVLIKIEADTYILQDKFFRNEDINFIAVQNGILNLRTKELQPFTPDRFFFNKLPIDYSPSAYPDSIIKFLTDVLSSDDDFKLIQEIFGYLLYRDYKFEKAFMFLGSGRNGKGKTVELMKRFLGIDNCANISLQSLDKDNFAMGELFNKMANLNADLSKTALNETGNFKSLTGHDLISAPRKFLTRVNFTNYAKMVFCANDLPITKDITNAFFMRWILVDFKYTFVPAMEFMQMGGVEKINKKVQDPEIIEKISNPDQMSGLLNWAIAGLERLLGNNDFSTGTTMEQVKTKWLRKSSSLNAFIMDNIVEQWDGRIVKTEFRRAYSNYCKKYRLIAVSDKEMKDTLAVLLGVTEDRFFVDGSQQRFWVGLSFNDNFIKNVITNSKEKVENNDKTEEIRQGSQDRHSFSIGIELGGCPMVSKTMATMATLSNIHEYNKKEPEITIENISKPGKTVLEPPFSKILTELSQPIAPNEVFFDLEHFGNKDGEMSIDELIDVLGVPESLLNAMLKRGELFQVRAGIVKKV